MMNGNPSVFRRAYDYVALFAVLHVLAAFAGAAYLVGAGVITAEKLRAVAAVLRGDDRTEEREELSDDVQPEAKEPSTPAAPAGLDIGYLAEQSEMLRLEAERIKAELDQRLTLNNSIMLRVTTQREEFRREREQAEEAARRSQAEREEAGFRKQIAIFEALSPKVAMEHLLNLENADEAARILLEMDTRKAKKIVESAKSGAPLQRMQAILRRLRDVAPERMADFESKESNP